MDSGKETGTTSRLDIPWIAVKEPRVSHYKLGLY